MKEVQIQYSNNPIDEKSVFNVITTEWQNLRDLMFKLKIKEMLDARLLQEFLNSLLEKNLVMKRDCFGKKYWKLYDAEEMKQYIPISKELIIRALSFEWDDLKTILSNLRKINPSYFSFSSPDIFHYSEVEIKVFLKELLKEGKIMENAEGDKWMLQP